MRVRPLLPIFAVMTVLAGVVTIAPSAAATPPSPATHLVIVVDPNIVNNVAIAGQVRTYTVDAEDDAGNIDTSFAGSVDVTSTNPLTYFYPSNQSAATIQLSMTNGSATIDIALLTTGNDYTLTAVDLTGHDLADGVVAMGVSIGQIFHVNVDGPTTVGVSQPFTVTVTQQDGYGNTATVSGDPMTLSWDVSPNTFATSTSTAPESVTGEIDVLGNADLYVEDVNDSTVNTTFSLFVGAPVTATHLQVDVDQSTATAGIPRQVTIQSLDDNGNTETLGSAVTLTSTDGSAVFNGGAPVSLVNGTATVPVTFSSNGDQTVSAASAGLTGVSAAVTVTGGVVPLIAKNPPALESVVGDDMFGAATEVSTKEFPAGNAGAVVLARSDDAADATVGTVLAAAKNAPLLFTTGSTLPASTLAELNRVLPLGRTVYLLGGPSAVPAAIADQVTAAGYDAVRVAGADRVGTALSLASAVGDPGTVLLASDSDYADALVAGPAAVKAGGVVLLTDGAALPASDIAYLDRFPGKVYAVGGQAAEADPHAIPVVGVDRYATAAKLAAAFWTAPNVVGIASGTSYSQALSGAAYLSHAGGPMLLTGATELPTADEELLKAMSLGSTVATFGSPSEVSQSVTARISSLLGGS